MIMEKLFVPYELAVKLKEKGFDEDCLKFWNFYQNSKKVNLYDHKDDLAIFNIKAPIFQQVIDWFRDKYNICISSDGILNKTIEPLAIWFMPNVYTIQEEYESPFDSDSIVSDYYKALNIAIEEALKLI